MFCCVTEPELVNVTYDIQRILVVENNYNVTSQITIFPGCLNGPFESYVIHFLGTRSGYDKIGPNELEIVDWTETNLTYVLEPEYTYSITVSIKNSEFLSDEITINFTAPAGGKQHFLPFSDFIGKVNFKCQVLTIAP